MTCISCVGRRDRPNLCNPLCKLSIKQFRSCGAHWCITTSAFSFLHVLQTKALRDWQLQVHYQTLQLHWQIIRFCHRHSKRTRVSYKLLHQSWSPFTIKQLMSWSTGLLSNQLSTYSPLHYLIMCLDILLTLKFHWYLQQFIEWKYAEIKSNVT